MCVKYAQTETKQKNHMDIKKLLLLALLFIMPLCIPDAALRAQAMTDEQVLDYVTKETQRGASQSSIVAYLIKRGVTTAQLQRVRRKAERMKAEEKTGDRTKGGGRATQQEILPTTAMNKTELRQQELGITGDISVADSTSQAKDLTADMDLENARKVFGRNIFSIDNLTFAPSQNIATPANYVLGAGDEVIVNIWGASQQTLQEQITPDGYIVVPGVGPVHLGGLTVSRAKAVLKEKLGSRYANSHFDLSLGGIRSLQVQVMGEVVRPGTYTLPSLSSAFNALYSAGGINEIGTLRDIRVFRQGQQVATIDVYDYLLHGNTKGDVRLHDGDVILVGPYDCLVEITGNVKRPMFYEMKKTETVKDLLDYAGGFDGKAYTKNVRLKRSMGAEYSIHSIEEFQMGAFTVADGDLVEADENMARFNNLVEVRGAVKHPGQFQLGGNIQSVKDLVLAADGLLESAYTERAIMHREREDKSREMTNIDIVGILNGTATDVPLRNNDVLFIPNKLEMDGERTMQVAGEINYPGVYPYADKTTLKDVILQAGGMTHAGSLARIDVYRRLRDAQALQDGAKAAEYYSFALDEDYNLVRDTVFELKPYDVIYIRKSPGYEEQRIIRVEGQVNFPGTYAMTTKNYRLSDLIRDCGGVSDQGYAHGASLIRVMTPAERQQRDALNLRSQIEIYEDGLREGKDMNMQVADSLLAMKSITDNTYPVAIELDKALTEPGCVYDLILREGDVITVPRPEFTVKVSGEVMHPVAMAYEEGKNLNYYIRHAGGYARRAYRSRVYGIHMNGTVVKLSANSIRDIEPGTEIVVPSKAGKKGMSTAEIMSMSSTAASLSSVIVALMNVITR
jgi:protein involved in polysaccharide export with SLBB domain